MKGKSILAPAFFAVLAAAVIIVFFSLPVTMAITIASGNVDAIQARIDRLEEQAVAGLDFLASDKAFLIDLYDAIAWGGRIMGYPEASAMLSHYLHGYGAPLVVHADAYIRNSQVRTAMETLEKRIMGDLLNGLALKEKIYQSEMIFISPKDDPRLFYLSNIFSLSACAEPAGKNNIRIAFSVTLDCRFPSYADQIARHGNPHQYVTPFATLSPGKGFTIDDGLSHHLTKIGLACEFVYSARWEKHVQLPKD